MNDFAAHKLRVAIGLIVKASELGGAVVKEGDLVHLYKHSRASFGILRGGAYSFLGRLYSVCFASDGFPSTILLIGVQLVYMKIYLIVHWLTMSVDI